MKILAWLFPLPLSLAAAQAASAQSTVPPRQDYTRVAAVLDSFVSREMVEQHIPAVSIALVDDQNIVWARGFGVANPRDTTPATAETVYRVGSVSKLFTDIGIMQLVEQHKVDLDVPVSRYLRGFAPANPFGRPITLREMMAHRSGLVREPPVGHYFDPSAPSLDATVASLNRTRLIYPPGSHTKYSNAAIATVGDVLQEVSGQPFADGLQRSVLDPLGLAHSAFSPTPAVERRLARGSMWTYDGRVFDAPTFQLGMAPAGSMYTTVLDLGHFISVLFAHGRNADRQVVQPATLDTMWTPQFARAGSTNGFGLGFHVGSLAGHRAVGHNGAIYGFATTLSALPDDKLGVVVVATLDGANATADRIANGALQAMLANRSGAALPHWPATSAVPVALARKLAGRYVRRAPRGEVGVDLIEHGGGRLAVMSTRGGSQGELRMLHDTLVVDDPLRGFGPKYVVDGRRLIAERDTLTRRLDLKPPAAPQRWRGLIGEYGWNHDILYILEKDRKLWALIEWFFYYPLQEISPNVFSFPAGGLYDGERLVFTRDAHGRATRVAEEGVVFQRRNVGPEEGAQQLKITPLRPVAELRKEALASHPPHETGDFRASDLVELTKLDPTIKLDIRYATTNNFLNTVFYSAPRAFMQRPAAEALVRANRKLAALGYGLLVHDAYRPWYVTKMFWDATPDDKKIFVADPAKGSNHNRGAAVDLTLYDLKTGKPIEMVGTYDETTDRSYPDYPGGTSLQRWHRLLLRRYMEAEGFTVYEAEWWHFDYHDWQKYPIGTVTFDQIK